MPLGVPGQSIYESGRASRAVNNSGGLTKSMGSVPKEERCGLYMDVIVVRRLLIDGAQVCKRSE